jgi:hypothetical protein
MDDEKSMLEKLIVYKNRQLETINNNYSVCNIEKSKIVMQLDRLLYLYFKSLK